MTILKMNSILKKASFANKQDKIDRVLSSLQESESRSLIILENQKIAGILTKDDVFQAIFKGTNLSTASVDDLMTKTVFTVKIHSSIKEIVKIISEHKVSKVVVFNNKDIAGVLLVDEVLAYLEKKIDYELSNKDKEIIESNEELNFVRVRNERVESELYYATDFAQRTARQLEVLIDRAKDMTLEAKQSSIAKSNFLTNISHEIRTPMNHIVGYLSLLEDTYLNSEQHEYLKRTKLASDSLLTLINDILDYTSIETGHLSIDHINFNFKSLMVHIYNYFCPFAEAKNIEFNLFVNPSIPLILNGDPGRFRQVVMNLCDNAIKFTEKGTINIKVDLKEEESGKVTLLVEIQDTGIGIAENTQEYIFQLFEQGDKILNNGFKGVGIGLAISKKLVQMMGGDIGVDSELAKGSLFWFKVEFEKVNIDDDYDLLLRDFHNKTILVIDDHVVTFSQYKKFMLEWGCSYILASSYKQALQYFNKPEELKLDLIIINDNPPRIDLSKLVSKIESSDSLKSIPKLCITSTACRGDASEKFIQGFAGYLSFPFNWKDLHDCMAMIFNILKKGESLKDFGIITSHIIHDMRNTKGVSILVVDDDEINRKLVSMKLHKYDIRVDTASSGKEAIDMVNQHSYNLIFMDCVMPGLDGFETTKKIRQLNEGNKIPIVIFSSDAFIHNIEKSLEAGVNDYLLKPVNFTNLIDVVKKWVPSFRVLAF